MSNSKYSNGFGMSSFEPVDNKLITTLIDINYAIKNWFEHNHFYNHDVITPLHLWFKYMCK